MSLTDISSPPSAPSRTLLTASEAALRAGCTRQMLYSLRYYGLGPPVVEAGNRRLAYDERELIGWLAGLGGSIYQVFDWRKLASKHRAAKNRLSRP